MRHIQDVALLERCKVAARYEGATMKRTGDKTIQRSYDLGSKSSGI